MTLFSFVDIPVNDILYVVSHIHTHYVLLHSSTEVRSWNCAEINVIIDKHTSCTPIET